MESTQKQCTRCILDEGIPKIRFDKEGVCSYCHLHDELEKRYPLDEKGKQDFDRLIAKIKSEGRNRKYDCIVGLSGGCDSTYALYSAKKLGLRILAVNFDDGWGSKIAAENVKNAVNRLNIDFRQIKADTQIMNDWYRAFLKASVPEPDLPCGIGYLSAIYQVADEENIRYIIVGNTFRTEGMLPLSWHYLDGKYFEGIVKKFAKNTNTRKINYDGLRDRKGFNRCNLMDVFYFMFLKRIKVVQLLVHIGYNKSLASELLSKELGWTEPGAKHFDNLHQALVSHVVRKKFKHDWRKIRLAARVRSKEIPKTDALEEVSSEPIIEAEKNINFCLEKLGIGHKELDKIMSLKPRYFYEYPTYYSMIKLFKYPIKLLCKMHLLHDALYEKYFD